VNALLEDGRKHPYGSTHPTIPPFKPPPNQLTSRKETPTYSGIHPDLRALNPQHPR